MTVAEDLQAAYDLGINPYYETIVNEPGYQSLLKRIKDTKPAKNWIQSPIALPRFTTDQFEEQRAKYVAKYGSTIQIPSFEDIVQWKPRAKITNEELAAHQYAQRYGMPSPLSDDQLEELAAKKLRFLRMLQAPEGWINRNASQVLTAMDNANDALFTFAVLGQIATKLAPRALGRVAPIFGWAQGAADVLNLFNVAAMVSKSSYSTKRFMEKELDKNPFHKKFWAERTERFGKRWPGIGELLQIPQVTQNMFGVGLCLGGIMGTMNDALIKAAEGYISIGVNIAVTLQHPTAIRTIWADAIDSAMLVWNAKDWVDNQSLEQVTLAAQYSLDALMPTWIQVDTPEFLEVMKTAGQGRKPIKDPAIIQLMKETGQDPFAQQTWPIIDENTADLGDLSLAYGKIINDNLTSHLQANPADWRSKLLGEAAVNYHASIISALSDDHVAVAGQTAIAGAVKDMALETLLLPPNTPQKQLQALGDWINAQENKTGSQPNTKEIRKKGIELGIKWNRIYPVMTSPEVSNLFPGWQAIQDQLGAIYTPGNE